MKANDQSKEMVLDLIRDHEHQMAAGILKRASFIVVTSKRMVIMKVGGIELSRAVCKPEDTFNFEHGVLLCLVKAFIMPYHEFMKLKWQHTTIVEG